MNFIIIFASDWEREESATITTLEELKALQDQYGHKLVIDFNRGVITVYDDCLE